MDNEIATQLASLEDRIKKLESRLAEVAPKPGLGPFQRMVSDGRGRDIVVGVGGNNGGY